MIHRVLRRISPSKFDGWLRCQQQWQFVYLEGQREPPGASLALGRAFDTCANNVYERKLASGETAPAKDVRDLMAACWDVEAFAVVDWHGHTRGELTDAGVRVAGLWRDRCAAHIQPSETQQHLSHEVRDGDEVWFVTGRTDVSGTTPNGRELVIDHKCGQRRFTSGRLQESSQVAVYTGVLGVDRFEMHVGVVGTKTPDVQLLGVNTTPAHFLAWIERARKMRRQVEHAIVSGDFLPNRQHVMCSRRWCGFWQRCEKLHGGRVKD